MNVSTREGSMGGRRLSKLLIFLAWLVSTQAGYAQESEESEPVVVLKDEAAALHIVLHPFEQPATDRAEPAPTQSEAEPLDPCDWNLESPHFQEDSREVVRGATCHSFRWFDGLFGKDIDYPEDQVNGLLTLGAEYTQYDHLDTRLRIRVRAPLPNMSRRWDLILGRGDDDAFISDTEFQDQTFYNPGLINRETEDSWLLGLGNRRGRQRQGWDWSVGVKLRAPPIPYVKTQWYYSKRFTDNADLRFRQTFFWRNDDGFGTTSRADYAWSLDHENVLRWEGVTTLSEDTQGTQWYLGHTWYHLLPEQGAFSVLGFIRGETNREVTLNEYGFKFIWRRNFTRDWLYLSLGPSVTWPRYYSYEKREMSLGVGAWIEMEFGDWSWAGRK